MTCAEQLAICLQEPETITCISCDEAKALRCIALAKIRELTCSCMSAPTRIGDVYYASPIEAIRELRQLVTMTFAVCEAEALEEGPVMLTVWENKCGTTSCRCPEYVCDGEETDRFHAYTDGDS